MNYNIPVIIQNNAGLVTPQCNAACTALSGIASHHIYELGLACSAVSGQYGDVPFQYKLEGYLPVFDVKRYSTLHPVLPSDSDVPA